MALYFAAELAPFLPADIAGKVQAAVLLLGALGVYAVPNDRPLELPHPRGDDD